MKPSPSKQETSARIIDTARRLFRHYGYEKTTVADIAQTCGMSTANVYRFFASKSAINETICHLVMADLEADLRGIAAADRAASLRLGQMVERVARFTMETYATDKKVHELVAAAIHENWDAIQQHVHVVRSIFADVIADGIASGEFKPQEPADLARRVCFSLIGFWHPAVAAQCTSLPDIPTPAEMTAFLLHGLKG